ncbi:MAG: glycine--tRNA ligase subunit beta [Candidatus Theseobacter exili]|nr:glycine--tRNA ligase subunit beta [Candidatus Theseobacter exili]
MSKNRDFLLEIGTEEIPAGYLAESACQLVEKMKQMLDNEAIGCQGEIKCFYTPRRLVLFIGGLDLKQSIRFETVKGPPVKVAFLEDGQPSKAAISFSGRMGIPVKKLETVKTDKGSYVVARKEVGGQNTSEILIKRIPEIITGIAFPKSMRWGTGEIYYARPVRWLVAVFGAEHLKISLDGIESSPESFGNRHMGNIAIPINNADISSYIDSMKKGGVIVDPEQRKAKICKKIKAHEAITGRKWDGDQSLLDTVTNLVESVELVEGSFDSNFLSIPEPILVTSMKSHQKYFPLSDASGKLTNRFLVVHNGSEEIEDVVVQGNERVLNARLNDAKFFWEEDRKIKLSDRVEDLKKTVFQEKLGSYFDKIQRIRSTAGYLAKQLNLSSKDENNLDRSAFLSKADLLTEMVGEFPSLQGIMGGEYARVDGEEDVVALALNEQYLPRFSGDRLPSTLTGALLALSDKADTVAGCFSAGLIPTGSQDPYALRRMSLGMIRILEDMKIMINVTDLFKQGLNLFKGDVETVHTSLMTFFTERVSNYYLNKDYAYDVIEAVISTGLDIMSNISQKLDSLSAIREKAWFQDAVTIIERTQNILKGAGTISGNIDETLFNEKEELELNSLLKNAEKIIKEYLEKKDYSELTKEYAKIFSEPVHRFFDKVLINVPDKAVRENRLCLMKAINDLYTKKVADLSRIVQGVNRS